MSRNRSIGGYLGLELSSFREFHKKAVKLNTGRSALAYILRTKKYNKVYVPYFTCDVVLQPINKLNITYEFYKIDENLEPVFDFNAIKPDEAFLYTNYFGLKSVFIKRKLKNVTNLIVDNAQAFFAEPIKGINTFYSPRKFFGVPDGGYLYTDKENHLEYGISQSYDRMQHLIKQIDVSTEEGYGDFLKNETFLNEVEIEKMSLLTQGLLQAINYKSVAEKRIRNFNYLADELDALNTFSISPIVEAPLTYPLLITGDGAALRKELINNKIYCPVYWPNVMEWCEKPDLEYHFARNLVHLPIDQRYGTKEMRIIANLIKSFINE